MMKFNCGNCGKAHVFDPKKMQGNTLSFGCDNCDNTFYVGRNAAFCSRSRTSELICENCGEPVIETRKVCPACNFAVNKTCNPEKIKAAAQAQALAGQMQSGRPQPAPQPKQSKLLFAASVILVIAALIVLVIANKDGSLKDSVLKPIAKLLPGPLTDQQAKR